MWGPRICPVCREELPERGNRRVRLPWRPGWALVHEGDCYERVVAQGVLELDRKPSPLGVVWMRRYRAALAAYPRELTSDAVEDVRARARLLVPALKQQLVGDEDVERARQRHEEVLRYARWYLARLHAREVSAPARTELLA